MPKVSVRGRILGYEVQPPDFDKNRLTVVFIHGSGGDREHWRAQLDGLSHAANMLALELPGHGVSDPPGESTVDAYSQWVAAFVESLGLQKIVLVGHSLGSAITQWIALSGQPWLAGIGLVGAGARLRVQPAFLTGLLEDRDKAMKALSEYAVSQSAPESVRQKALEDFQTCSAELLHGDLTACDNFDIIDRLKQINLPAWIVVGEDDRLTPVKYAKFLHENLEGSKLAVVPGAGHMVMAEKPEAFNQSLRDFLEQLGD